MSIPLLIALAFAGLSLFFAGYESGRLVGILDAEKWLDLYEEIVRESQK